MIWNRPAPIKHKSGKVYDPTLKSTNSATHARRLAKGEIKVEKPQDKSDVMSEKKWANGREE